MPARPAPIPQATKPTSNTIATFAPTSSATGTSWLACGGGSNCTATGSYSPTTPSGSGHFVLTSTTYNGNLGGLSGADARCLTELTTNTSWRGYASANANGQLVAGTVHAALCISNCTNLMPLTTYFFAKVGDASAGGASFMSDSNGLAPNDSANWPLRTISTERTIIGWE